MLPSVLEETTQAHLQALCDVGATENARLDFKRELPGRSDADKREFTKDVCAMANADGGDLIYGIEELEGAANRLAPIQGESADTIRLRLGQLLESGIEPRIPGTQIHVTELATGSAVIVRVPASFDGPHRATAGGQSKFVVRVGTHTSEMTYMQLRSAFDRTATLIERAAQFVETRTQIVTARQTGKKLALGPVCLVHVVPLASFGMRVNVDVAALSRGYRSLMLPGWTSIACALNLDGIVAYPPDNRDGTVSQYSQVFRSGRFEVAFVCGAEYSEGRKELRARRITEQCRAAIERGISILRKQGISGPAIVRAAVLGVQEYEFSYGNQFWAQRPDLADRADLILPEAWVESMDLFEVDSVASPMLDVLWQSFGIDRCLAYTAEGQWAPQNLG